MLFLNPLGFLMDDKECEAHGGMLPKEAAIAH